MRTFLRRWHRLLGLSTHAPGWYRERLREELRERRHANGPWQKLSETADIMFAISRAQHDGFPVRQSLLAPKAPLGRRGSCGVCAYMLAKYTSRWLFYQTAAAISAPDDIASWARESQMCSSSLKRIGTMMGIRMQIWYAVLLRLPPDCRILSWLLLNLFDVPPKPSSPPDNVFHPGRPPKDLNPALGSETREDFLSLAVSQLGVMNKVAIPLSQGVADLWLG
ncbi:uncharacterized protein PG986_004448 [Apiospora aurea]|uniref:Uncharacterized protein n=1 Tax=Apiospora aurea TaxID=335848 RepID=A0ABR1QMM5_9PEZI